MSVEQQQKESAPAGSFREDRDTMGPVKVSPADALYQAQTQRSLENFAFQESERMPLDILRALVIVKLACARANRELGKMTPEVYEAIEQAARKVCNGIEQQDRDFLNNFPLAIWQTGSGTQSNMNMNEVLATLANQHLNPSGPLGAKSPVHPNDHVNMSQSSNDVFPAAMAVASTALLEQTLLPAGGLLLEALEQKATEFKDVVKLGRTHMMDAVPMTLGDEFSAYAAGLRVCLENLRLAVLPHIRCLALGATAVGSGLNTPKGFDECVAKKVSEITGLEFKTSPNKFFALSQITPATMFAGNLMPLVTMLLKMCNDLRLLSSGPRAGLGELALPANEPGSSVMPGKVNPTQVESLAMVCTQVMGMCNTVFTNNTFGHLQLNVFLPCTAHNICRAAKLVGFAMENFTFRCLRGIQPRHDVISRHVNESLMLVTALNTHIGYDNAAKIAKNAHEKGINLKQSALELGLLTEAEFDKYLVPAKMAKPHAN